MKSRVHPKYKTKYRVGNWPAYKRALVQRDDITLWLSIDAIGAWTPSVPSVAAAGPTSGTRFCSIFSQLLQLFPRTDFHQLVTAIQAERHARGFTCWGQFVAMLFCQLGRAHSLREICGGLASCEGKLAHLGITAPARSTLAYANAPARGSCSNRCFINSWCAVRRSPGRRSSASRTNS